MTDFICPFNAMIAQKRDYACPYADEVIRRGGSEYVCLQPGSHQVCSDAHDNVKHAYLDSQGLDDDLLTVPHSTYVKIQFGCVLGLHSSIVSEATNLEDISALITEAIDHFNGAENFPFEKVIECIAEHKLEKRGRRKK
jgi:hypothetical protein